MQMKRREEAKLRAYPSHLFRPGKPLFRFCCYDEAAGTADFYRGAGWDAPAEVADAVLSCGHHCKPDLKD